MVYLITSTVSPNPKVQNLNLTNSYERLKQYKDCIEFYLLKTNVKDIVYCDNSNVDINLFADELNLAIKLNKNLEILSFKGNSERVLKQGKGYGEGEIINYALRKSSLINNYAFFFKITGRLQLLNIDKISKYINEDSEKVYINYSLGTNAIDSRFYAMSTSVYREYFSTSNDNIDDANGYYLEHSFYNIIVNEKLLTSSFILYPRVIGVSGSTGTIYHDISKLRRLKLTYRDVLSWFGRYTVKY